VSTDWPPLDQTDESLPPVELPPGTVAMRVRLFESQAREMARAVLAPWPAWMERLYALESLALRTPDPSGEMASVGTAVSALGERLHYRLRIVAFAVTAMEELGWRAEVDENGILLTREGSPPEALAELEREGIYGPLCKVCILDRRGVPWIGSG
jgi:hypothetical protein